MHSACETGPRCWRCGGELKAVLLPLGRRSECPACHAELHVCRQCRHYDPGKAKQCREPVAEPVLDKTRANFCDWFQLAVSGARSVAAKAGDRAALEALFGDPPASGKGQPTDHPGLNDLFKT